MRSKTSKKRWFKTLTSVTITLALVVPLLAACGKDSSVDDKTERVLRIASNYGGSSEEYFRQQFSEVYEYAHPNIKIELVPIMDNDQYRYSPPKEGEKQPDPMEKLKELMTGANPPDIVMLDLEMLPELVSNNMLLQLDSMIAKDKFDTSDIVPSVIDGLKSMGDGKLYALSPFFSASALMYNKKLFDDAGVPYPTDDMTWDEMFNTAKLVSKGDGDQRKYGFSFSTYSYGDNLFYEINNYYTNPLQLRMFNDAGEKMTVDSEQWEKVWKTMQGLVKEKVFPEAMDPSKMGGMMRNSDEYNPFQNDMFKSGRLAMTIVQNYQINDMINANKNAVNVKGFTPIDWDIVTVPTHSEAKGKGGNIYMNGVMGINAKAQNQPDAWNFLKFVNGEDFAKLKSRSMNQMVSRKKYIQPQDGLSYNIKALYSLTPVPFNEMNKMYREKPYIGQVQGMGMQYFKKAMDGTVGVRESLKEWQAAGDAALQQLKDNPNAQINMGMGMGMGMSKPAVMY
ncbi:MAG: extracellular solute-binding protein family 1 [Paenibacillus sp.]|nr:extracellular solute-binding protein family 1 [Paenibacillus sp.]